MASIAGNGPPMEEYGRLVVPSGIESAILNSCLVNGRVAYPRPSSSPPSRRSVLP